MSYNNFEKDSLGMYLPNEISDFQPSPLAVPSSNVDLSDLLSNPSDTKIFTSLCPVAPNYEDDLNLNVSSDFGEFGAQNSKDTLEFNLSSSYSLEDNTYLNSETYGEFLGDNICNELNVEESEKNNIPLDVDLGACSSSFTEQYNKNDSKNNKSSKYEEKRILNACRAKESRDKFKNTYSKYLEENKRLKMNKLKLEAELENQKLLIKEYEAKYDQNLRLISALKHIVNFNKP